MLHAVNDMTMHRHNFNVLSCVLGAQLYQYPTIGTTYMYTGLGKRWPAKSLNCYYLVYRWRTKNSLRSIHLKKKL